MTERESAPYDGACEVPLIQQLRSIPKDYRTVRAIQWADDGRETGHQFIPVGHMMHRAADELEAAQLSQQRAPVKYVRYPNADRRISLGDDFAGDAWVRWTAVGHTPEDAAGLQDRRGESASDAPGNSPASNASSGDLPAVQCVVVAPDVLHIAKTVADIHGATNIERALANELLRIHGRNDG